MPAAHTFLQARQVGQHLFVTVFVVSGRQIGHRNATICGTPYWQAFNIYRLLLALFPSFFSTHALRTLAGLCPREQLWWIDFHSLHLGRGSIHEFPRGHHRCNLRLSRVGTSTAVHLFRSAFALCVALRNTFGLVKDNKHWCRCESLKRVECSYPMAMFESCLMLDSCVATSGSDLRTAGRKRQ